MSEETIAKILNAEDIFKSFPSSTKMQPKYKVKVVFLNTSKSDPTYTPVRVFSVNGNKYSVVDSGIAYMPKEAHSALSDAVGYIAKPKNSMQKEYGLNVDDLTDKYDKVPVPNYDLTVLEEYYPVMKNGSVIHMNKADYNDYLEKKKTEEEIKEKFVISKSEIDKKESEDKKADDAEKKNFSAVKANIKAEAEALTEAVLMEESNDI